MAYRHPDGYRPPRDVRGGIRIRWVALALIVVFIVIRWLFGDSIGG